MDVKESGERLREMRLLTKTGVRPHLFCWLGPNAQPVLHTVKVQDDVLRGATVGQRVVSAVESSRDVRC
jgi:hypothetical protein